MALGRVPKYKWRIIRPILIAAIGTNRGCTLQARAGVAHARTMIHTQCTVAATSWPLCTSCCRVVNYIYYNRSKDPECQNESRTERTSLLRGRELCIAASNHSLVTYHILPHHGTIITTDNWTYRARPEHSCRSRIHT